MPLRRSLSPMILAAVRRHPGAKQVLKSVDGYGDLITHSVAHVLPKILQPDPREIFITLTANCNLRCRGCRYGREFMAGSQLSWPVIRDLLDDAKSLGINANLWWGLVLLAFGLIMFTMGRRTQKRLEKEPPRPAEGGEARRGH